MQHQFDDGKQRQREYGREQNPQHHEMAGLAMGEIPCPILAALHPERGGHDAVQHLPKGRRFVVDWIVHKSLVCRVCQTSIANPLKNTAKPLKRSVQSQSLWELASQLPHGNALKLDQLS